jgi:hypothetical protein
MEQKIVHDYRGKDQSMAEQPMSARLDWLAAAKPCCRCGCQARLAGRRLVSTGGWVTGRSRAEPDLILICRAYPGATEAATGTSPQDVARSRRINWGEETGAEGSRRQRYTGYQLDVKFG